MSRFPRGKQIIGGQDGRLTRGRKPVAAAFAGLLMAGLLAACGDDSDGAASDDSEGGLRHVSLGSTAWESATSLIPWHFCIGEGYFKKAGIDIEGQGFSGGGDTIRALTTGAVDFAIGAPSAVVATRQRGEDIKLIASGYNTDPNSYVALAGSGLKGIDDFKGKTIGISSPGSGLDFITRVAMDKAGIKPDKDAKLAYLGGNPELVAALKSGAAEIVSLTEPTVTQLVTDGTAEVVTTADDLFPGLGTAALSTRDDVTSTKKGAKLTRDLLAALDKCMTLVEKDPAHAVDVWLKDTGAEVDRDVAVSVAKAAAENHIWGLKFSQETLDATEQSLQYFGDIKGSVDWSSVLDESFLPK